MKQVKRRILSAVSLHHAINDASIVALPTIFPVLYNEGDVIKRYSDIGTIILIGMIAAFLAQLWIGHNVKSRQYRTFLALDALIVGVFLILLTFSRSFLMLVLFFIGVRLGASIYHPVGVAWISHAFRNGRLDHAMGTQSAFGDVGVLVAFISTGFMAERFGWRNPLLLWGTLNLAAVAAGLAISRGTIEPSTAAKRREPVSWRETICRLRPFMPMIMLGGLAWGVTLNYAPSLLNHKLGIAMSKTGIILGCWIGAGACANLFYGRISQRIGRTQTIVTAYTIIFASALVIGLSESIPLTIAVFIVYGLLMFITFPAILSFVGSYVDERNRTAAFSIVSNLQLAGNSIFAFISGFLSDAFGIHTPFLLLASAAFLVVVYVLVLIKFRKIEAGPIPAEACPKDIVSG
jgi:MFS family permease